MDITAIQERLALFALEREWDQFHSPKNLAMALAGESGELLELFQWLTEQQSQDICVTPEGRMQVEEELADICIYLLRICDKLDVNLESAIIKKIAYNETKYPAEKVRGKATKYNRY